MSKSSLDQYRGKLNPQQVADGMNAAAKNARRLLYDAELLLRESRFPSATALAILAIEEAGKNTILRQLAASSSDAEIKNAWKGYRSHRQKNLASIVPNLAANGARIIDDFKLAFDGTGNHPAEVDMVKQLAIYTDCLGDAHWSEPDAVIDSNLANQMVKAARILAPHDDQYIHSAREIDLWAHHMGPVMDQPLAVMKAALSKWYEEMRREGLVDSDEDTVRNFIGLQE
ncbi:MAG TPA: AbiV family abortive infection protein [Rhizomicrobium sp.]|jgi:AbiV family abortive infection protein|nr:AbiV family abortive infection protein [Rhizomicrobium sp.]